jgi:hypothetical protein
MCPVRHVTYLSGRSTGLRPQRRRLFFWGLPAVLALAAPRDRMIRSCRCAGADEYMLSSVDPKALARTLDRLIALRSGG